MTAGIGLLLDVTVGGIAQRGAGSPTRAAPPTCPDAIGRRPDTFDVVARRRDPRRDATGRPVRGSHGHALRATHPLLTWRPHGRSGLLAHAAILVAAIALLAFLAQLAGVPSSAGIPGAATATSAPPITGSVTGTAPTGVTGAAPTGMASGLQGFGTTAGIDLLDLAAKTVLVLGLLYLTLRALRRLQGGRSTPGGGIAVLETRAIAPKASLYVVSIRGRELVVGLSPAGLVTLADLQTPRTSGRSRRWAAGQGQRRPPIPGTTEARSA